MITEWDCFGTSSNITVPDASSQAFTTLQICQRCHALVGFSQTYQHAEWHNELIEMGAEKQ